MITDWVSDEKDFLPDDLEREETTILYLVGYCGRWSATAMHYDQDKEDKEKARRQIREKHEAEHPNCPRELHFGYI